MILQVALMAVCFGGVIVLMIGAGALAARQRAAAMEAWQAFSRETGIMVSGTYPMISFHAGYQGGTVSLMHHVHRGHKGQRHYRHFISARIPIDTGDLVVDREGFFDMLGKAFGGQDIQVGDAVFDPAFRVRASNEHQARAVLSPPARQALLQAVQQLPTLHIERGMVSVSHPGIAQAQYIRPQVDLLVRIANAFGQHQQQVSPPMPGNPYGGNPYG